jgi:hypothetical protein
VGRLTTYYGFNLFFLTESRTELLQSVQDILYTSMEEGTGTPSDALSLAGDSEPGGSGGGPSEPEDSAVFKTPGLISDLTSSLTSYFAPTAKTRIARGENFHVKARRLILSGDIAYLIDWESGEPATAASLPDTS